MEIKQQHALTCFHVQGDGVRWRSFDVGRIELELARTIGAVGCTAFVDGITFPSYHLGVMAVGSVLVLSESELQ